MTTLGYGDYIPETTIGRIASILATLCGITIIVLAMTTITSNFLRICHENKIIDKLKSQKKLSKRIRNIAFTETEFCD
ncbi:potassium voltage-gated channel protein Shal-like [Condylostylus longicornis]|uniref:potassium voltage-gated channel protein Shal-like n=1 Tax=Condylostylus longicornis TaxID=2530218 RepID=UPI00244E353A|nr:potassium voltage-gated channel protein Shal-like [Condylostylus longicornis]